MLVCVDSFALSKGNDPFSFEKNDEFTRTLGQWIYEHTLLIFNPCFIVSFHLSPVQDFRIPVQHTFFFLIGSTACFIAKCSKQ